MSKAGKQVMDIKTSKGLAQSSNEELRAWTVLVELMRTFFQYN